LTVTWFDTRSFKVGVSPETLRRTTLGGLQAGGRVNLERAVGGTTRLGGHMVQGHVDTVATVARVAPDGNAVTMRFAPRDPSVLRYIVEKGFVAVDGASLTVTAVHDGDSAGQGGWWEVMLIAYTQSRIVTAEKKVGDVVNVEVDMVGKYVEKNVRAWFDGQEGGSKALELVVGKLVEDRLKARGL
jgi:riboflavin synthase